MTQEKENPKDIAFYNIYFEARKMFSKFPKMDNPHEGYALILHKLDDLKKEVWKQPSVRSPETLRIEATKIAAVAFRFVIDVCAEKEIKK